MRSHDELTLGERAADQMRNGFGSWTFVASFALFLGGWMVLNSTILRQHGFDKYPYILLNLCLSCLAALQGAFILIAAKRADRVAAELSSQHYDETTKIDEVLRQNTELTVQIHVVVQDLAKFRAELDRHLGQVPGPVERRDVQP